MNVLRNQHIYLRELYFTTHVFETVLFGCYYSGWSLAAFLWTTPLCLLLTIVSKTLYSCRILELNMKIDSDGSLYHMPVRRGFSNFSSPIYKLLLDVVRRDVSASSAHMKRRFDNLLTVRHCSARSPTIPPKFFPDGLIRRKALLCSNLL